MNREDRKTVTLKEFMESPQMLDTPREEKKKELFRAGDLITLTPAASIAPTTITITPPSVLLAAKLKELASQAQQLYTEWRKNNDCICCFEVPYDGEPCLCDLDDKIEDIADYLEDLSDR